MAWAGSQPLRSPGRLLPAGTGTLPAAGAPPGSAGRFGCPRAPLPAPFQGFQKLLANINSVVMKSLAAWSCVEQEGKMLHLKRVFSENVTSASAGTARATWAGTQLVGSAGLDTGGGSDVPSCHHVPTQELGGAWGAYELQNQGSSPASQNKNPSWTQQQRPRGFWSLRQPPASTWSPPSPSATVAVAAREQSRGSAWVLYPEQAV